MLDNRLKRVHVQGLHAALTQAINQIGRADLRLLHFAVAHEVNVRHDDDIG